MSEVSNTIDGSKPFDEIVLTIMDAEGCDHKKATREAVKRFPQAHRNYVLRANAGRPQAQNALLVSFDKELQAARPAGGDAIALWNELVNGYVTSCGNRAKATSRAVREHPEAHREMLVAYNAQRGHPCNR